MLANAQPASAPALIVTGRDAISVRAGTSFAGHTFAHDAPVAIIDSLQPGADYAVVISDGAPCAVTLTAIPGADCLGGFHFAPGGNARARAGGDNIPAINPYSVWDLKFRPACPDPRGMVLVQKPGGQFWCDIYLLGVNHTTDGTSKFGVTIADGNDCPHEPGTGKRYTQFDYQTAVAVMAHHGKGLLGLDEFPACAFGVTEKTSCRTDPKITSLDAPRTSRFGIMQAAGSMWVWGHDGDPDEPRASMFGGSWVVDGYAGSRCAHVAYYWPGSSDGYLGARGRSDHLQPASRRDSDGVHA